MTIATDRLAGVASLEALYAELAPEHVLPGWATPEAPLWREPRKTIEPTHWRYAWAKAALDAAGRLIDTSVAERRNLILANPQSYPRKAATTRTMIAAYQMVLPGERARSHRHMPNALRVVIDAQSGMSTTVDGMLVPMENGDVLLTPGMSWHGHDNVGSAPAYWVDVLDVPLVDLLEPMFFEEYPDGFEPVLAVAPDSPMRFPWAETEHALARAADTAHFGRQVALDKSTMPTFGLWVMALEAGRTTEPLQTTANNIYVVLAGSGTSTIDGRAVTWERGDVFAAPAWRKHHHRATSDAVVFRSTDEPVMRMLGYLR